MANGVKKIKEELAAVQQRLTVLRTPQNLRLLKWPNLSRRTWHWARLLVKRKGWTT